MQLISTNFPFLYILEPHIFCDFRGEFIKQFSDDFFAQNGLESGFCEAFYSVSKKGVLRGMHFQTPPKAHTKIVFVSKGAILDVVVDLRLDSPTFRQSFSVRLDAQNHRCLYIPKGFAHGFLSLEDDTKVHYMQTSGYDGACDSGISWDSLGFDWVGAAQKLGQKFEPADFVISERDQAHQSLESFLSQCDFARRERAFFIERVLITGASGFIGTNLIKALHRHKKITALVREDSQIANIAPYCEIWRYSGVTELIELLKTRQFCGVFHLATLYLKNHAPHDISRLIAANLAFGTELCEALAKSDFRGFFVNVGTFWQFYKNMPNHPLNLYAATKSAFERIIDFYASSSEITFCSIYLNDTYGPNDPRPKIFNLWLEAAKSGENLAMSGGAQLIDLIYIDDVVAAFCALMRLLESPLKSLAMGKKFTLHCKERKNLRELAEIFQAALGQKLEISWGAKPYAARENFIPFEGGDALPNWAPKIDFSEGAKRLIAAHGEKFGVNLAVNPPLNLGGTTKGNEAANHGGGAATALWGGGARPHKLAKQRFARFAHRGLAYHRFSRPRFANLNPRGFAPRALAFAPHGFAQPTLGFAAPNATAARFAPQKFAPQKPQNSATRFAESRFAALGFAPPSFSAQRFAPHGFAATFEPRFAPNFPRPKNAPFFTPRFAPSRSQNTLRGAA